MDHCEANSQGFGLRALDDREELAVAAGAPDDFLCAHFVDMPVDAEIMSSVCLRSNDWLWPRTETSGWLIMVVVVVDSARVWIK